MLLVFDKNEKLLTMLTNNNPKACPYFDAEHLEKLNGEVTLDFSVPFSHSDAQYVAEENLVAFRDMDSNWQLFIIRQTEEVHDGEKIKTAYCEPACVELIDEIVTDLRPTGVSAAFALTQALTGTRWQIGTVDDLGLNTTNFYYESALSAVTKVANTWKGELRFRVAISGNVITGRYVDLFAQRGSVTGKRFEYSKDITTIKRKVDSSSVKTAMYGRGKGEETEDGYGRRTTFDTITWTIPTNPADKPNGQEWVGDPTVLAQFGRPGNRHRYGIFEDKDETDPAALLQKTWDILQEQKTPLVQYDLTVVDLERLTGRDHEKTRLGDTVIVRDMEFVPALIVNARVIEIKRYLDRPEGAIIKLGNFITNITDETGKLKQLEQIIGHKEGQWDGKYREGNPIQTSWLEGEIDALQNQVKAGTGTVTISDTNGILITDTAENPTKAIRLLGGILAIANGKDGQGNWNWRTFGTGDGFTADEINAGVITADRIHVGTGTVFDSGYDPSTKTTVIRSASAPSSPLTDDLWLDTSVTPNQLKRWSGTVWVKSSPTTPGEVGALGINDAIATSKLTGAINVATNNIQKDSNFYWDTSGFYAKDPANAQRIVRLTSGGIGISTNGGSSYANALTASGLVASAIAAGTITGVTISAGTISGGSVSGASITGGSITSNTSINVTTDLTVGNNVYVGGTTTGVAKMIRFNSGANIQGGTGSLGYGITVNCNDLVLSCDQMFFGASAKISYWNTSGYFESSVSETGFCGTGGYTPTVTYAGTLCGVGVNFRIKKTYTPGSISLSTTASYGGSIATTNITNDGFWLYLTNGGNSTYSYWRGTYTA